MILAKAGKQNAWSDLLQLKFAWRTLQIYCDKVWFQKFDMNFKTIFEMMNQSKSGRVFY